MLKKLNVLATLGLGAIVAACGGDSGGSSSGPTQGSGTPNNYYFRLVNALPDGPILALQDDGVTIAGNVGYHLASVITSIFRSMPPDRTVRRYPTWSRASSTLRATRSTPSSSPASTTRPS
jgi:hypothetical protein